MTSCKSEECNVEKIAELFRNYGYENMSFSEQLSIEEIERIEATVISLNGAEKNVPFGLINSSWGKIKEDYRAGDCLLSFTTDDSSWNALAGRAGYILVRDNKIVSIILTEIS